jgi:hypothetical protein
MIYDELLTGDCRDFSSRRAVPKMALQTLIDENQVNGTLSNDWIMSRNSHYSHTGESNEGIMTQERAQHMSSSGTGQHTTTITRF